MRNKYQRHSLKDRLIHRSSQIYKKIWKNFHKNPKKGEWDQQQLFFKRKKKKSFWVFQNISFLLKQKKTSFFVAWAIFWVVWCILFLVFWPLLKIQNIYISRQWHTINIEQAYSSTDYIRWKNILFLDTLSIANRLQRNQPAIQNIEFQVESFDTLNIKLWAYPSIFQSEGYLILWNGSILFWENKISSDIPNIHLSEDISELSVFWETLNVDEIRNIQLLLEDISKNIPWFSISHILYQVKEKELLISNNIDTIFIFDMAQWDIREQVKKLAVFQKESEDITQKKYIYIDVRIPGKLFLCGFDEEFKCRQNITNIYWNSIFSLISSSLEQ